MIPSSANRDFRRQLRGRVNQRNTILVAAFLILVWTLGLPIGCHPSSKVRPSLRLATTTSTRDSGLMDLIIPPFEKKTGIKVKVIAVGTGKALRLGELGEVDALLVHAKQRELEFVEAGHATRREAVMYNYFEIVGPKTDPAGIEGCLPADALQRIHSSQALFISRGDQSGTHLREKEIWDLTGLVPGWKQYVETGQGMGATLIIADEKQAYTLVDRGTYLAMKEKISLRPLTRKAESMRNEYGVLSIAASKIGPDLHTQAEQFVDYLQTEEARQIIRRLSRNGEVLFRVVDQPTDNEGETTKRIRNDQPTVRTESSGQD